MPRLSRSALLTALVVVMLMAGGSQALANHVTCGDVITQDTRIDSDLVGCPGDGIVIGASDITLDLGGHTVSGNAIGSGIANSGHHRVTVRDGTVREFHFGLALNNANANSLQGLRVWNSRSYGIWLSELTGTVVEDNIVTGFSSGIMIYADTNTVRHNVFSRNGGHGIQALDGADDRIERNIVTRNGGDGIHGFGISSMRIEGNLIAGNGSAGISVDDGPFGNRIEGNRIRDNGGAGVSMQAGAHGNRVAGNSVLRNGAHGVFVSYGNGNEFTDNRISQNGGDGMYLGAETADNTVHRNHLVRNSDDGLDVDSALTTIARNRGVRNGDLGIEAEPGVIDGGGNRASANGNPLQCLNVSCR